MFLLNRLVETNSDIVAKPSPEEVVFRKRRAIWRPAAWRLLRENACAKAARLAVPPVVRDHRVLFPHPVMSLGLQVQIASARLPGAPMSEMLKRAELHGECLELGLVALAALHAADLAAFGSSPLQVLYPHVRALKIVSAEVCRGHFLSARQKRVLWPLLSAYVGARPAQPILVHGDLQASHLIVDLEAGSLGFVDLEAMRIGHPVTNFAQLWEAFYYADRTLGRELYRRFAAEHPDLLTPSFDASARAELALRCHAHIPDARRFRVREYEGKARRLLDDVLSGATFEEICMGRVSR